MKIKKFKNLIIVLVILVIVVIGVYTVMNKTKTTDTDAILSEEVEYTVANDSISISVAESGSINPVDKRVVKSEIDGTVDKIYVTEGDIVENNQILISLMSDNANDNQTEINDINLNIEKTQKSLNDLYDSQGDLNIYAPSSGIVSNMSIEVGDQISANYSIASVKDTDNSYIEVYFSQAQYDKISVGDRASSFMISYFSDISGIVSEKNSTPVQMGGGTFGYLVTVKINNPGGLSLGDLAQVTVSNSQGTYNGMINGKIVDVAKENITSKVAGKIKSVNTENGKYVSEGSIIATIEGDDLDLDIADKQNTIAKYKSQMSDLIEGDTVYSPMKGTVLKIAVSEEEVVDRTTSLMTVADLDNMEIVIQVDELDINKIALGQQANITCDAFKNETFSGKVTKISMEGTNVSGVTTYDVTVKLDDRKSLMSGMNVDVEILADKRDNVIVVPIEALHKSNGTYMVTVKDSAGNKNEVNVSLGLTTDEKVEITSGLKVGDVIVYNKIKSTISTDTKNVSFPGMGGGNRGVKQ
ncbi:MAG: efflux RND transporter periplasmic adaptor subunit [Sedimentibacter sp.]